MRLREQLPNDFHLFTCLFIDNKLHPLWGEGGGNNPDYMIPFFMFVMKSFLL